jgi:hypothetical protein
LLGIFVGTAGIVGYAFAPLPPAARVCFAVIAIAILVPQNAFPGADVLDWIGLAAGLGALATDFVRSRNGRRLAVAPPRAGPS